MFKLTVLDVNQNEINIGDWVKVCNMEKDGVSRISFYVPVSINANGRLIPFDTHCWNYIEKINKNQIPVDAKKLGNDIEGYVFKGEKSELTDEEVEEYCFDYHIKLNYNQKYNGYKITLLELATA